MIPAPPSASLLLPLLTPGVTADDLSSLVERVVAEGGLPWLVQQEGAAVPVALTRLTSFHLALAAWEADPGLDRLTLALWERTASPADPTVLINLCTALQRGRIVERPFSLTDTEAEMLARFLETAADGAEPVVETLADLVYALRVNDVLPPSVAERLRRRLARRVDEASLRVRDALEGGESQ